MDVFGHDLEQKRIGSDGSRKEYITFDDGGTADAEHRTLNTLGSEFASQTKALKGRSVDWIHLPKTSTKDLG